jgi:hypothetical protein
MTKKLNNILKKLNIIGEKDDKNLLTALTEVPKKEPSSQTPHYRACKKNYSHQVDLLFLPEDDGFRYLLVCVDIATKLCDAQPLKTKNSVETRDALKKIYKRKILSLPTVLGHDAGTEFEKEFKKHFGKITKIFKKVPYRHRQQSVVEAKNKQIGMVLNAKMTAEELETDETSRDWVSIVPEVIKLINAEFQQEPYKPDVDKPIIVNNYTKDLIPIGTTVRIKLEAPKDVVSGAKLHGTFRTGDLRWSKELHTISHVILNPDTPPLYLIDGDDHPARSKYELMVSDGKEARPNSNKAYAQEVVSQKKIDGRLHYEIRWEDGTKTFEPRTEMIKQIPDLIKEFKNKK